MVSEYRQDRDSETDCIQGIATFHPATMATTLQALFSQRSLRWLVRLGACGIFLTAHPAGAQTKAWRCLDGDGDQFFITASAVTLGAVHAGKMPELVHDAKGKPLNLTWTDRPSAPPPIIERLDEAAGGALYQVTYPLTKADEKELGSAPWAFVMLAIVNPLKDGASLLRPFYLKSGDQVERWETFVETDGDIHSVEVRNTLKGNGVYWTNHTFVLAHEGAHLTDIISGGRRMNTTHREYDSEGRAIKTSVIEGN